MNGILVINKEIGYTSRDVVNIVSKELNTKKVGHTGTLDPMASGVLVLCIGQALKVVELLTNHDKEYVAGITLGIATDTLDMEGKVIKKETPNLSSKQILETVKSFKGEYIQEVPKYSALKVNGKKLYDYARKNIDVVLPKRKVTINNINIMDDIEYSGNTIRFKIKCSVSKGTYIRSLVRDIGDKLGVPAVMNSLIRTKQGIFKLEDAISIEDIRNGKFKLIDITNAFPDIEKIVVDDNMAFKIKNGVILDKFFDDNLAFIFDKNNKLIALYKNDDNKAKVYKMFM